MKRWVSIFIIMFMLANLTGCAGLQKKFTRKKKKTVKMPRIYQVRKYEKKPSSELYKKHYAYWASWQSELVKVLGQNRKKDILCIEQIISNLKDMQGLLIPEKAAQLEPHIDNLSKVRTVMINEDLTQFNIDYIRRTVEKEDRTIKRDFGFNKVKDFLIKMPGEQAPGQTGG